MRAIVKKDIYYKNFTYGLDYLIKNNINVALYRTESGKYIAIRNLRNEPVNNLYEIYEQVEKDEPIYKQQIRLQTGQRIRKVQTMHRMVLKPITEDRHYRYSIYTVDRYI